MNILARWTAGTGVLRRRPAFARLFAARSLTALAGALYRFALIWLVYVRTGSALDLGGTAAAMALSSLLAPFFGAITDRMSKRVLLVVTDAGAAVFALGLAGLALPAHLAIAPAYFCAFGIASLGMLDWTAVNATIPLTVDADELSGANGLWSAGMTVIQLIGPAIAGVVVATIAPAATLIATALLVGCAAVVVSGVRPREAEGTAAVPGAPAAGAEGTEAAGRKGARRRGVLAAIRGEKHAAGADAPASSRRPGVLAEVRDGIRYVLGESILIRITILMTALNLAYFATDPMVLWLLQRRLHLAPTAIGFVFAAQAAGTLVASTWFAGLGRRLDRGAGALIGSCAFGIALEIWAAAFDPFLAGLAAAGVGFAMAMVNLNLLTLRQEIVPPPLLGRVLGTTAMLGRLAAIIGPTVGALVVGGSGLATLFAAAGGMVLVAGTGVGFGLRAATLARMQRAAAQAPAAGAG